jgi:hypothetical protein
LGKAVGASAEWILASPAQLTLWLIALMFMIDVTMASLGYVLTMKPLDAHIRSANPYASGWMAALMCYPPFILMDDALNYHIGTGGLGRLDLLARRLAGAAGDQRCMAGLPYRCLCLGNRGVRYSLLEPHAPGHPHHGPYAWSKHPAYVSKNLFWWFAVFPSSPPPAALSTQCATRQSWAL